MMASYLFNSDEPFFIYILSAFYTEPNLTIFPQLKIRYDAYKSGIISQFLSEMSQFIKMTSC